MLRDYGYPKRRKVKWETVTWRDHEDRWVWSRQSETPIKRTTDGMSKRELMNRLAAMR